MTLPPYASVRSPREWIIRVKAVPGSSRTEVVGTLGDSLKVRVAAPPEDGRANEMLTATLARALGVAQQSLTLVNGAASQRKQFVLTQPPSSWR